MTKKTIRVSVTKADIAKGVPKDDCECPIALALRRRHNKPDSNHYIMVGNYHAWIGGFGYSLPRSAQGFVSRFDEGKRSKPFTFTMRRVQ